jgi:hypothetical protein
MLVIPTQFQMFRGVMLGILCISTIINALSKKWIICKSILIAGVFSIVCSLFFTGLGFLNNTPGALSVVPVFVLWPLVYIFLMGNIFSHNNLVNYIKTIIVGSITVCFIEFLVLSEGYGLINMGILEFFTGSIGIYEGRTEIFLMNSATLIYSLPMSLCIFLMPKNLNPFGKKWNALNLFSILISILCILMIGRRAMLVIAFISPIIILIIFKISNINIKIKIINILFFLTLLILFICFIFYYFDLNLDIFANDFLQAFGFDSSSTDRRSSGIRGEQFFALIEGWMHQPILGFGHGASIATSVRDIDTPWAYELTYISLLFQVGILGLSIYFSAVLWYLVKSIIIVRGDAGAAFLILPPLVGSIEFLIASATNPYLLKFDYLWTIFFSVMILNFYLVHRYQRKNEIHL